MPVLTIAAVGRMKRDTLAEQVETYLKQAAPLLRRLGFSRIEVREVPESRKGTPAERMREEAEALIKAIGREDARLIVLDERGRMLTSREFADLLAREGGTGSGKVALVIGGPDGLDPQLRGQARHSIAFGRMTWPHRLVRLMLAEQIYRAGTIKAGHPYHRE